MIRLVDLQRNPSIKLYGLPWAYPGWISPTKAGVRGNPYTDPEVTADYMVRWVNGAKRVHGLTIDFLGVRSLLLLLSPLCSLLFAQSTVD